MHKHTFTHKSSTYFHKHHTHTHTAGQSIHLQGGGCDISIARCPSSSRGFPRHSCSPVVRSPVSSLPHVCRRVAKAHTLLPPSVVHYRSCSGRRRVTALRTFPDAKSVVVRRSQFSCQSGDVKACYRRLRPASEILERHAKHDAKHIEITFRGAKNVHVNLSLAFEICFIRWSVVVDI